MGEAKVDEKGVRVLCLFPSVEVMDHPVAVPLATGFRGSAPLGGVLADGEQFVGRIVAVSVFAGAHGVVAGAVEDCGNGIFEYVFPLGEALFTLLVLFAASGQVP